MAFDWRRFVADHQGELVTGDVIFRIDGKRVSVGRIKRDVFVPNIVGQKILEDMRVAARLRREAMEKAISEPVVVPARRGRPRKVETNEATD